MVGRQAFPFGMAHICRGELLVLGRVLPYTFNFAAVKPTIHRGGVKRTAREIEAGMRSNATSFPAKVGPKKPVISKGPICTPFILRPFIGGNTKIHFMTTYRRGPIILQERQVVEGLFVLGVLDRSSKRLWTDPPRSPRMMGKVREYSCEI